MIKLNDKWDYRKRPGDNRWLLFCKECNAPYCTVDCLHSVLHIQSPGSDRSNYKEFPIDIYNKIKFIFGEWTWWYE